MKFVDLFYVNNRFKVYLVDSTKKYYNMNNIFYKINKTVQSKVLLIAETSNQIKLLVFINFGPKNQLSIYWFGNKVISLSSAR